VATLHRYRIIHQDINPANLILHPTTLSPTLIDFDLALWGEPPPTPSPSSPSSLYGTLVYLAPEQTGRLAGPIDPRADLNSTYGETRSARRTGFPIR
jgi:serine/threonine protein kinase